MSCQDKVSRIIVKRSFTAGEKPTVPPNEDHRSGLWSATDIYIGEQFFNVADGKLYTRSNAGIEEVATSSSNGLVMYKAKFTKAEASNAVIEEVYINNTGETITTVASGPGDRDFNIIGFNGKLTNIEIEVNESRCFPNAVPNTAFICRSTKIDVNSVGVITYDMNGLLVNGVLVDGAFVIITIKKYQ